MSEIEQATAAPGEKRDVRRYASAYETIYESGAHRWVCPDCEVSVHARRDTYGARVLFQHHLDAHSEAAR